MTIEVMTPVYTVEYSPRTYEDTSGGSVQWVPMSVVGAITPIGLKLQSGQEPGKLSFRVNGDSAYANNGWYPCIATKDLTNTVKPDGVVGSLSLPSYNNTALKPFCDIRLKEGGVEKWVGILVAAELDISTETWTVTAMEVPRWRLSRINVRGVYWYNPNKPAAPIFIPEAMPLFNEKGNRNQWAGELEASQLSFFHSEYKEDTALKVKHWALGDILNYLRKLWLKSIENGLPEFGGITWAKVTATTHPALFETNELDPSVTSNVSFNGSFLEAIDEVIRRAGMEWTVINGALKFYTLEGMSDITLNRGQLHTPSDIGRVLSGKVSYNWADVATGVAVYGNEEHFELTLLYDPNNEVTTPLPRLLKKAWTDAAENDYRLAEIHDAGEAQTDYTSVYQRFLFKEDSWESAFGLNRVAATGAREILAKMVSSAVNTGLVAEVTAKVWRHTGQNQFKLAPDSVGLAVHPDGTIQIHGYDPADGFITATENNPRKRMPRYICDSTGLTWKSRAFAITLTVTGDEKPVGKAVSTTNFPKKLEERIPDKNFVNQYRKFALHLLDGDNNPVEESYSVIDTVDRETVNPVKVFNTTLKGIAEKRLDRVCRPDLSGVITITGCSFAYTIGQRITELTGGGSPVALPTVTMGGLIQGVTLDFENTITILEISNG